MTPKILLIDIETSPNTAHVWGLYDQNVSLNQIMESSYTLCFAAKWLDDGDVIFDSIRKSTPQKMIRHAWNLLDKADIVIHYNGKKFDIPTLQKEFLLHNLSPPSPYKQIDLLHIAKQQFRFPSNKLQYVAHALGLGSKVEHIGHSLWVRCMSKKIDVEAWDMMERYNKGDVTLLEKVYNKLLPWVTSHPNYAVYSTTDRPPCSNCGSLNIQARGYAFTQAHTYSRFVCKDCGTWLRGAKSLRPYTNKLRLVQI